VTSVRTNLGAGAIVLALLGCSAGDDEACPSRSCAAAHEKTSSARTSSAVGTIAYTSEDGRERVYGGGPPFAIVPLPDGALEIVESTSRVVAPEAWCTDGGAPEAGDADASDAGAGDADAPRDVCAPREIRGDRLRVAIRVRPPKEEGAHALEDLHAEAWLCASPAAFVEPYATPDGRIEPGCFEAGRARTEVVREPLRGTILVRPPPERIEPPRERGHSYAYRLELTGDRLRGRIDVSALDKTTVVACDYY
jgi:hypothetical protein